VIRFVDDHTDGGYLECDWWSAARQLKIRLIDAWLEGKNTVSGSQSLTDILSWFSELDREEIILQVIGGSVEDEFLTLWSDDIYDFLDVDEVIQPEIRKIMIEALEATDNTSSAFHDYDNGPCHFSGSEIYASNPEAVVWRFHMILGTN
jgi:hypothetical protein